VGVALHVLLLVLALKELVVILLVIVVGRLTLERSQRKSVLVEDARGLKIANDLFVLLERTRDLLPGDKLGDLLRELPELLEVDMTVGQSEKGENL
jgi:hypothetical protein